jgi:hypothetical protein
MMPKPQVDVYRFLNGFPTKNEFILLHATRHGALLCDSVPIINGIAASRVFLLLPFFTSSSKAETLRLL